MKIIKGTILFLCLILLLSALGGCAALDVSHLERRAWKLNSMEKVSMEFMNFDYEIVPRKDSFGLRGKAHIKKGAVPVWAEWVGELWIQGYLSDADGNVLAKGLQVFSPCSLDENLSIPFDFELKPDSLDSGPLFVSFGYRMVLQKSAKDNFEPFMAIERAVTH
jgi:hypothetical protein